MAVTFESYERRIDRSHFPCMSFFQLQGQDL